MGEKGRREEGRGKNGKWGEKEILLGLEDTRGACKGAKVEVTGVEFKPQIGGGWKPLCPKSKCLNLGRGQGSEN